MYFAVDKIGNLIEILAKIVNSLWILIEHGIEKSWNVGLILLHWAIVDVEVLVCVGGCWSVGICWNVEMLLIWVIGCWSSLITWKVSKVWKKLRKLNRVVKKVLNEWIWDLISYIAMKQ